MPTIIKHSDHNDELIFEKCSRAGMRWYINNLIDDWIKYGVGSNETMYWRLDDGTFGSCSDDEPITKKFPVSRVIAWIYSNEHSLCFFGEGTIDYNRTTGMWDLNMKYL